MVLVLVLVSYLDLLLVLTTQKVTIPTDHFMVVELETTVRFSEFVKHCKHFSI